jgi:hypothetical protein
MEEAALRILIGAGLIVGTILLVMFLRPKDGRERPIVRLPGMWIVLGLLLTFSTGTGVAVLVSGVVR